MFDITALFTSIAALIQTIDARIRHSKGTEHALLVELKTNIDLIQTFANDEVHINKAIEALEITKMKEATESGFNFNALKRGKVEEDTVGDRIQLKTYVGWTTEKLFLNIYIHQSSNS